MNDTEPEKVLRVVGDERVVIVAKWHRDPWSNIHESQLTAQVCVERKMFSRR